MTSRIIKEKYEMHTQPFLNNLSESIAQMDKEMEFYDYVFSEQHTGTEWLKSINRVFDDSIRPNMRDSIPSMLKQMFYV
jgi:hypothetical protein